MRISLLTILLLFGSLNTQGQKSDSLDWLLIYYLPYDNDLSSFSTEIVNELVESSEECENIGIVVQADLADTNGHKRFTIHNGKIDTLLLETETSDIVNFQSYLTWISENFMFRHHSIFFLNHGANLEHMGIDVYPERQYYHISEISESIELFNGQLEQKSDLLFLQQCNRSSIEIVYEFRDCAHYTLASQLELGAPNSYYRDMINFLHENPTTDGKQLGKAIAYYEGYDMYNSYTLIDNALLDNYISELAKFINQLKKTKYDPEMLLVETYFGETYWDLHSLIRSVETSMAVTTTLDFVSGSSAFTHLLNPKHSTISNYCGVAIYSPFNKNLKFHQELAIFDLLDYKWLRKNLKKL